MFRGSVKEVRVKQKEGDPATTANFDKNVTKEETKFLREAKKKESEDAVATKISPDSVKSVRPVVVKKPCRKPPKDPCDKWQAVLQVNTELATYLKENPVHFGKSGQTRVSANGKEVLKGVAEKLNRFPWIKLSLTAHSSALPGPKCKKLTMGRAKSTKKYLKLLEVKNRIRISEGKCGKRMAITMETNIGDPPPEATFGKNKAGNYGWSCNRK